MHLDQPRIPIDDSDVSQCPPEMREEARRALLAALERLDRLVADCRQMAREGRFYAAATMLAGLRSVTERVMRQVEEEP